MITLSRGMGRFLPIVVFAMQAAFAVEARDVPEKIDAVRNVKQQILDLAQSYMGQGDPDLARQRSLDALVQKLINLSPQPPVKDRLTYYVVPGNKFGVRTTIAMGSEAWILV